MSVFCALRSFSFMAVIVCGLVTAAWSGLRHAPFVHDHDRGDVVWIDTGPR
ncbi:hypothetical protein [Caulobacter sp. LARHSG274]|jgi:hypothetical protein